MQIKYRNRKKGKKKGCYKCQHHRVNKKKDNWCVAFNMYLLEDTHGKKCKKFKSKKDNQNKLEEKEEPQKEIDKIINYYTNELTNELESLVEEKSTLLGSEISVLNKETGTETTTKAAYKQAKTIILDTITKKYN